MKLSDRLEPEEPDDDLPPPPKRRRPTRTTARATKRVEPEPEPEVPERPARTLRARTTEAAASPPDEPQPSKRPSRLSNIEASDAEQKEWAAAKRHVRQVVLERLAPRLDKLSTQELADEVRGLLDELVRGEDLTVSPTERRRFVTEVLQDTLGYGPLDPLLADPDVTEVMCNAYDEVWVERAGKIEQTDVAFTDDAQYRHVIDKIVSAVGRRVDESSPMVDARLPDGSRVNAIIPPLALGGAVLTIRKFSTDPLKVDDLVGFGTWTPELAELLTVAVQGRLNVVVSGGTGTGKTTNLNVLSSFIPSDERIITIEDAAEVQLQQPHVVNLETRPANAEGAGAVGIRELVRNALRMRPDRIIVGECRGAEALDMLQAMNTGHEGSMTTVHANGAREALSRLETMVLMAGFDLPIRAIREQIASAVHLVMQVSRLPDGRRVITSLTEVQGLEGDVLMLQDLFTWVHSPEGGTLEPTGLRAGFADRLEAEGFTVPASIRRGRPRTQ